MDGKDRPFFQWNNMECERLETGRKNWTAATERVIMDYCGLIRISIDRGINASACARLFLFFCLLYSLWCSIHAHRRRPAAGRALNRFRFRSFSFSLAPEWLYYHGYVLCIHVKLYSMYHFTDLITMLHNMPCNLCISKASDRFALWRGEKKETLRTFIASI